MENEYTNFITNLKYLGYKEKNIPNEFIEVPNEYKNFETLFMAFNDVLGEISDDKIGNIKPTKNEIEIFNEIFNKNDLISSLNNDHNLLELSNEITDMEIENLNDDIFEIEREIQRNQQLFDKEKKENEQLTKVILNMPKENVITTQLENFQKDFLGKLHEKCKALNKSITSIIAEFNWNLNKANKSNNTKAIIGYRKINSEQFDQAMTKINELLCEYYKWLETHIKEVENPNENLIDINQLNNILNKIESTKIASVELKKNQILKQIQLSKEQYKNKLINEYIVDHKVLENNDSSEIISTYDLGELIKRQLSNEEKKISHNYTIMKNKLKNEIYEEILVKTKSHEISFNSNLAKIEMIINSIYPYLLEDLNVTQEIYDKVSEVTEIYIRYQAERSIKQSCLRRVYSEVSSPLNKITVDERDNVLQYLGSQLLKNYHTKIKIYPIRKVIDELNKFLFVFPQVNQIKSLYNSTVEDTRIIYTFLHIIEQNQDIYSILKKFNQCLVSHKYSTKQLIDYFIKAMKKIVIKTLKSNTQMSLYEAAYIFLFHKNLFKKQFGEKFSIYTMDLNEN